MRPAMRRSGCLPAPDAPGLPQKQPEMPKPGAQVPSGASMNERDWTRRRLLGRSNHEFAGTRT